MGCAGRITRHGACFLPRPVTDSTTADDDQKALRQRVRAALAAGLLPRGRLSSVVRRGTGRACVVCGCVIDPTELEHEVRLDDPGSQAVFVHEGCYRLWRIETNAIVGKNLDRGPIP
jgi:hypothetical protein